MFADSLARGLHEQALAGGQAPLEDLAFWNPPQGPLCLQQVRTSCDSVYQPHSHPEYGIVVCLKGEVLKTQLGRTTLIGPGESVMSNSGVEHASGYLAGPHGCEALCLTVERRALARLLPHFHLPGLNDDHSPLFTGKLEHPVLREVAGEIVRELTRRDLGHELVIEGLATRLLVETLRAWPRAAVHSAPVDLTPKLPRREFVRAYDFMRWCRKDAFRLGTLCRFLGSSEERFTRLFLSTTGCSPAQFYNRLLLERARNLLADPARSIKEVGFELGYKTSSHFVAAFRRHFRLPPQAYRDQLTGPDRLSLPSPGPSPNCRA